jgi:hypothetical protein
VEGNGVQADRLLSADLPPSFAQTSRNGTPRIGDDKIREK